MSIANYDHIVHDDGGRAVGNQAYFWIDAVDRIDLVAQTELQVDDAVYSELGSGLAGRGVERDEVVARSDEEDPTFAVYFRVG